MKRDKCTWIIDQGSRPYILCNKVIRNKLYLQSLRESVVIHHLCLAHYHHLMEDLYRENWKKITSGEYNLYLVHND